jgi:hypothetical protein
MSNVFQHHIHQVDLCVVGGGMPGLTAALAAARHGARVLLMQDRPVLGGNASSECRVHICGADRHNQIKNLRETGILEELRLENLRHNLQRNFSIWDTLLYEKALAEPNLTLLLNCTCQDATMDGNQIRSITGWQLTTQIYHTVEARIYADCSGDAILAPLTGALSRMGRESRDEYSESIAPEVADEHTMGMTCLFQAREYASEQPYEPPAWVYRYADCAELPYGAKGHRWWQMGYWWVELGGEQHSIHDTEKLRDELLKITFGVWDHIKNRCSNRQAAANWALDWVQFLPAKRESRRYIGEHVLTQNDIESGGHFSDNVAYGGWTMDDHHPAGFNAVRVSAPATIFHHSPSPYGIPYRCLYSRNVTNLMFAGRNASCTHTAMSSTRVMGTGCSMGQAVGTAAALAISRGLLPAQLNEHMAELQQSLLRDDAYIPYLAQELPGLTRAAHLSASQGNPEPVRDGIHRPIGKNVHAWIAQTGDQLTYEFTQPEWINQISLVLDSALDRNIQMSYHQKENPADPAQRGQPPGTLPRHFRLEGLLDGEWQVLADIGDNHQRLVRLSVDKTLEGLRFILLSTWGNEPSKVFAFYIE